jgi:hypothetical protein
VTRIGAPISKEELKEVLSGFKRAKSSRPDGWTMEFYRALFDFLADEILLVMEESRISSKVFGALNVTPCPLTISSLSLCVIDCTR